MSKDDFITIPITFVFKDGVKVYDYKSMINYFESRLKVMGYDKRTKIMIDHYDQDSFRNVVNLIYRSIYEKKWF